MKLKVVTGNNDDTQVHLTIVTQDLRGNIYHYNSLSSTNYISNLRYVCKIVSILRNVTFSESTVVIVIFTTVNSILLQKINKIKYEYFYQEKFLERRYLNITYIIIQHIFSLFLFCLTRVIRIQRDHMVRRLSKK